MKIRKISVKVEEPRFFRGSFSILIGNSVSLDITFLNVTKEAATEK